MDAVQFSTKNNCAVLGRVLMKFAIPALPPIATGSGHCWMSEKGQQRSLSADAFSTAFDAIRRSIKPYQNFHQGRSLPDRLPVGCSIHSPSSLRTHFFSTPSSVIS
jgi:hypothetical protein